MFERKPNNSSKQAKTNKQKKQLLKIKNKKTPMGDQTPLKRELVN